MLKVYYLNKPLSYMLSLILGELVHLIHLILHRTMLKLRPHVSSEVNWAFGQQQMSSLSHHKTKWKMSENIQISLGIWGKLKQTPANWLQLAHYMSNTLNDTSSVTLVYIKRHYEEEWTDERNGGKKTPCKPGISHTATNWELFLWECALGWAWAGC